MTNFLTNIFGSKNDRLIKKLFGEVAKINDLEPQITALTDEELKAKTPELKDRLAKGATLEEVLPEAFAVVREAARRTLGQRHYDVQLIGGMVLHRKGIAEMKTGEGKTLVATLPAYLNALEGKGVHVVTVNDYLARRDAVLMGQVYDFLGLSVGVINNQTAYRYDQSHVEKADDEKRDEVGGYKIIYEFLKPISRREAYLCDITYGTNNEYGFDYLRDNISLSSDQLVQRTEAEGGFNFALIDEVDSILIDESRTPLIISGPSGKSSELYVTAKNVAANLIVEDHYTVDEKMKAISLTDAGISKAEELLGVTNIYSDKGVLYVHHLETAVKAKAIYERDRDYVIKDGEVVIVDEFTGRLQPGRRWSEGLHQAIEAKEGVEIKEETRTYATVTLQNYFRLYNRLAGMTGTALTSAEEFYKVYGLDTVSIPTHQQMIRKDEQDLIFQTEKGKFMALARDIKTKQEKGQPVLIGTVSIEKNELLSAYLTQAGVKHTILNAKNHEQEGAIIAEAGKKGAVTVATNMAGRGIDIKLGGPDATLEQAAEIKALGGLAVVGTERHDARRIDNQLRGRSGRQGDPGATQFFISMEDHLMRIFGSDHVKNMMNRLGIPEDEAITNKIVSKAIEGAQTKIEGLNFDMRKHLLEYDDVINHQRITMYERRRAILLGGAEAVTAFLTKAISVLGLTEEQANEFWAKFKERETLGEEHTRAVKMAILQVNDMFWLEHLESIDYLKSAVRLRSYGQRDPLVEFKREALALFKNMEALIFAEALSIVPNIGESIKLEMAQPLVTQKAEVVMPGATGGEAVNANANQTKVETGYEKVGRNDLCPCGSGKKFKKCHGA